MGKFYMSLSQGKQRVVTAYANIGSGVPFGTALAGDDIARDNGFAAIFLYAEAPALCISTVA
jgi:hypothetical protein